MLVFLKAIVGIFTLFSVFKSYRYLTRPIPTLQNNPRSRRIQARRARQIERIDRIFSKWQDACVMYAKRRVRQTRERYARRLSETVSNTAGNLRGAARAASARWYGTVPANRIEGALQDRSSPESSSAVAATTPWYARGPDLKAEQEPTQAISNYNAPPIITESVVTAVVTPAQQATASEQPTIETRPSCQRSTQPTQYTTHQDTPALEEDSAKWQAESDDGISLSAILLGGGLCILFAFWLGRVFERDKTNVSVKSKRPKKKPASGTSRAAPPLAPQAGVTVHQPRNFVGEFFAGNIGQSGGYGHTIPVIAYVASPQMVSGSEATSIPSSQLASESPTQTAEEPTSPGLASALPTPSSGPPLLITPQTLPITDAGSTETQESESPTQTTAVPEHSEHPSGSDISTSQVLASGSSLPAPSPGPPPMIPRVQAGASSGTGQQSFSSNMSQSQTVPATQNELSPRSSRIAHRALLLAILNQGIDNTQNVGDSSAASS